MSTIACNIKNSGDRAGNVPATRRQVRAAAFFQGWLLHAALFGLCGLTAFLVRFDFSFKHADVPHLVTGVTVWVLVKLFLWRFEGLDTWRSRTLSRSDLSRVFWTNVKGSMISVVLIVLIARPGFPRSVYLIDFLLCLFATVGLRMTLLLLADRRLAARSGRRKVRTIIYGAGRAAEILLQDLESDPGLPYDVIGLVDDDPEKRGVPVHGVKVLGHGSQLAEIVDRYRVEEILIAIPSATGDQMRTILHHCRAAGVASKTVPGLAQIIKNSALAGQIRDVAMEDLLGRQPVRLDEESIRRSIEGRVVLVTGAGGSIGSELCRQIARFHPGRIVGYEISENALYELNRGMEELFPEVEFAPVIGSIQNARRLAEVVARYRPEVIYHAAAYKHVPMMEDHIFEAVENNVFGTLNVVRTALDYGVEKFVLISSDKAVRPTNVMGATKRIAELITKAMQNGGTKYVAVRFGNVLGSNGSVIPLFKKQIAAGGPVTITHPAMERFFMTISEAVQLVLQAAAMGEGGEIFVLDMGEPVKIVDLAKNLILLCGLRPGEDIPIEFTGIRPGEKLREELSCTTETTLATRHEKIRIFTGPGLSYQQTQQHLRRLRRLSATRDAAGLLREIGITVPDYQPSEHVLDSARLAKPVVWSGFRMRKHPVAIEAAG